MHDLNLALHYSDHLLILGGKDRYCLGCPSSVLNRNTIEDYFDVKVLEIASGNRFFYLPTGKMVKEPSE
jgi:ABC-type cobalamin/Fe3+-siderophores transport system ATPase subunit